MATKSRWDGGSLTFYDPSTYETVARMAPLVFVDDFLTPSLVIPAVGALESGVSWAKKIVGAAPPTVAVVANAVGGQVQCALTAAVQKQDAGICWADQKGIDVTKGAVFESRFRLSVLPSTAETQAVVGLSSNWIDGPDNNTCFIQVCATGNGALLVRSYDGVTTVSAASGVTLLATTWTILRIDATDVTDVKLFLDGTRVTTTGQINFAATGTLAVLQPYLGCYKVGAGAGVATMLIDYVKIWMNRA